MLKDCRPSASEFKNFGVGLGLVLLFVDIVSQEKFVS